MVRLLIAKSCDVDYCKMAPSKKRKRETEHIDSDDDDSATYGLRQILPVANLPIDFNGEPLDGMQYLFLVRCVLSFLSYGITCRRINRRDARKLPGVKHVANPYAFVPPQSNQLTCHTKADPLLPCKEWRSKFERHFHNFRGVSESVMLSSNLRAHPQ